jgi:hypothetical protein
VSDIIATAGTPEVSLGTGTPAAGTPHQVSSSWADMEKDLAAIAKEQAQPAQPASSPAAVTPPAAEATAAPTPAATPAPAAPVAPTPEVPEKFKGPDGKLDEQKVLKSYLELEKGFKRLQNATPAPVPQPAVPAAPVQAGPVTLSPFERQVAQDLINEAAAVGYAMPEGQAIAQAKVQVKLMEAKHQADRAATFAKVDAFEAELAERKSREQLEALKHDHPWVISPQGFAEVKAIMEEKPWLQQSPTPYADAVDVLLGRKAKSGQQGLVNMPTPTGAQNGAPPLPVTPAPVAPAPIRLETQAEIMAYVKTLAPEQEAEFWKKVDPKLKWEIPKQFRGV